MANKAVNRGSWFVASGNPKGDWPVAPRRKSQGVAVSVRRGLAPVCRDRKNRHLFSTHPGEGLPSPRSRRQRRWCGTTWPPSARVKSRHEKAWSQKAGEVSATAAIELPGAQNGLTPRRDEDPFSRPRLRPARHASLWRVAAGGFSELARLLCDGACPCRADPIGHRSARTKGRRNEFARASSHTLRRPGNRHGGTPLIPMAYRMPPVCFFARDLSLRVVANLSKEVA